MGYAARAKWERRKAEAAALQAGATPSGARGGGKTYSTSWRLKVWAKLSAFMGHRRMRLPQGMKWGGR